VTSFAAFDELRRGRGLEVRQIAKLLGEIVERVLLDS
jgi:hypothetical protein